MTPRKHYRTRPRRQEVPPEDRTSALFAAAAEAVGLDGEALAQRVELRLDGQPPPDPLPPFGRLLGCLERLTEQAERRKGKEAAS